jgi:hypothetical protein
MESDAFFLKGEQEKLIQFGIFRFYVLTKKGKSHGRTARGGHGLPKVSPKGPTCLTLLRLAGKPPLG